MIESTEHPLLHQRDALKSWQMAIVLVLGAVVAIVFALIDFVTHLRKRK